jgi:hypothetical protein
MRGDFIGAWAETWRFIWIPLSEISVAPVDLFSELYRDLVPEPAPPLPPPLPSLYNDDGTLSRVEDIEARTRYEAAIEAHALERSRYEELVNGRQSARTAYRTALLERGKTESDVILVLERASLVLEDYNIERLRNGYFSLVERFIEKFSLRYDLRRPFSVHPTLAGVFTQLVRDLKTATASDATLHTLMLELEDAIRDLRSNRSSGKIKSCIQKQINLLEAMGSRAPGVTANTLGRICDEVGTWPHHNVKDAMKALYRFTCDYPGIRHGGTAASQLRDIGMEDLVSMSLILAGFSPYLTDLLSSEHIYLGT